MAAATTIAAIGLGLGALSTAYQVNEAGKARDAAWEQQKKQEAQQAKLEKQHKDQILKADNTTKRNAVRLQQKAAAPSAMAGGRYQAALGGAPQAPQAGGKTILGM